MVEQAVLERLAAELGLPLGAVEGVAALLADGATVPFLARYRRERLGGLREDELWALSRAFRLEQSLDRRRAPRPRGRARRRCRGRAGGCGCGRRGRRPRPLR